MRIAAVHLLNDYSGSPKVLMQLLRVWTKNNVDAHLFICGGREGFLSNIPNVIYHKYWYRFAENILLRFLFLFTSQFILCIKLFFFLKKNDIVYINTVLPFGAGIAAKLKRCKVVYHIHETSVKPFIFKKILFGIAKLTTTKAIYVSKFLAKQEPFSKNSEILYNVLEKNFIKEAQKQNSIIKKEKIVLMICSLKSYKGVNEFVKLSQLNPEFKFKLVLNANPKEIEEYFSKTPLPNNLVLYPTQKNTVALYREATIILNLSDVNLWVETFGLTILEGMCFGLPAIVPPIGGITELVENGQNGFLINSNNLNLISNTLRSLILDNNLYKQFSEKAILKSNQFSTEIFEKKSLQIISNL